MVVLRVGDQYCSCNEVQTLYHSLEHYGSTSLVSADCLIYIYYFLSSLFMNIGSFGTNISLVANCYNGNAVWNILCILLSWQLKCVRCTGHTVELQLSNTSLFKQIACRITFWTENCKFISTNFALSQSYNTRYWSDIGPTFRIEHWKNNCCLSDLVPKLKRSIWICPTSLNTIASAMASLRYRQILPIAVLLSDMK